MTTMPKRGPGKNKAFLMNRLQDMYGDDFHPIMKMAKNCDTIQRLADSCQEELDSIEIVDIDASVDDDSGDVDYTAVTRVISLSKLANENWEKIAPYLEPKLTATSMDIRATEIPHEDWLEDLNDGE